MCGGLRVQPIGRRCENTGAAGAVAEVFGFDEVPAALRHMEAGAHFGKIVIRVARTMRSTSSLRGIEVPKQSKATVQLDCFLASLVAMTQDSTAA